MNKLFIKTYGCQANKSDSEVMAGILKKDGFKIVKTEKEANLIIVNSCSVKSVTQEKIIGYTIINLYIRHCSFFRRLDSIYYYVGPEQSTFLLHVDAESRVLEYLLDLLSAAQPLDIRDNPEIIHVFNHTNLPITREYPV